jgi:DDE family transposase
MNTSLRAYLDAIRQFPFMAQCSPQQYFRRPGKDFTRTRILHLERVVWLNVTLLKSTLCIELDRFFDWPGTGEFSPTKSALVQARQKLLPKFFKDLFLFGVVLFYKCFKAKRWKGMRLWAADGTGFRLPGEEWLGDESGWHGNQHNRPGSYRDSTRLLAHYDILNQIVTAVQFHTRHVAETVIAQRSIAQIQKDVCVVYDRGHASHTIPYLHQHYGSHCIIRMPVGFSNTVKTFVASGKIKSFLELTNFSAYTVNNCWQDIYSHFIHYNLQTVFFCSKSP